MADSAAQVRLQPERCSPHAHIQAAARPTLSHTAGMPTQCTQAAPLWHSSSTMGPAKVGPPTQATSCARRPLDMRVEYVLREGAREAHGMQGGEGEVGPVGNGQMPCEESQSPGASWSK